MNIFISELARKRKSIIIWSISTSAFALVIIMVAPTLIEEGAGLLQVFDAMPAFADILGIIPETMTSYAGVFSMYFTMISLCFAIQASNYGFGLVSVEETDLTADFLLTKPVKRENIITQKILASLVAFIITVVLFTGVSMLATVTLVGDYEAGYKVILLICLSALFIQLFFFGIGLFVSLCMKRIKSVLPLSMGLSFGMLMITSLARSLKIEFMQYISPFGYFDAAKILLAKGYDWSMFTINSIIVVVTIALSYVLYKKRDIKSL